MIHDTPDGWTEIDSEFGQQLQAFQRRRDGLVVSIEQGTATYAEFSAVTLPQNFHEDNQPIDHITEDDDLGEVEERATNYMTENPR